MFVVSKELMGCRLQAVAKRDGISWKTLDPVKDMGILIAYKVSEDVSTLITLDEEKQMLNYYKTSKWMIRIHPDDYVVFMNKIRSGWVSLVRNTEEIDRAELLDLEDV